MPAFLAGHFTERVRCLEQSFSVVVSSGGGDLGRLCDEHMPDVIMLELGADSSWPSWTNLAAHSEIPRIGFLNADPFDLARAPFAAAANKLGVGTFFTHAVSMGEYTPEFADRMFFWPNFVDATIFHEYETPRSATVLFSGSQAPIYPWRNRTRSLLESRYGYAAMEHSGWSGPGANRMPTGEDYARLLAGGRFVPACGTIAREVVRKHLEIPAVGSCLVAEQTESLRSFGFADMENCILGDGPELLEKIDFLVSNADEYDRVVKAGTELVQTNHTLAHRTQVHQWYELHRAGRSDREIDQDGPAGDLFVAGSRTSPRPKVVISEGVDRQLLASGWARFADGDLAAAIADFERCLEFTYIAEADLGLVYGLLASGRTARAESRLQDLWDMMTSRYGVLPPDPVVISTMVRLRLCQGDVAGARALARRFPDVRHPDLDRIRHLVASDAARESQPTSAVTPSICAPPLLDDDAWVNLLAAMLTACGQGDLAQLVSTERSLAARGGSSLTRATRALQRRGRRAGRAAMRSARPRVRRISQLLRKRWMSTPWARELTVVVHRESPRLVAVCRPRRTSVPQLVLGWILRSSDARLVPVADPATLRALEPECDMLYVSSSSPGVVLDPQVPWDALRVVVVERGPLSRPRPGVRDALRDRGFDVVGRHHDARSAIDVFVR